MRRTSLLTRTIRSSSTNSSRLAAANGVQWHQHQKEDRIDRSNQHWKAQLVWTWVWEKEKLKELRRKITHSLKDFSISRQCSRRRTSIAIGASTCNSNAKLERCHQDQNNLYSIRVAWEAIRLVDTACRLWVQRDKLSINSSSNKWCKRSMNNKSKCKQTTQSMSRSKTSKRLSDKTKWSWQSRSHSKIRIKSH